jgi:hypothetical protein
MTHASGATAGEKKEKGARRRRKQGAAVGLAVVERGERRRGRSGAGLLRGRALRSGAKQSSGWSGAELRAERSGALRGGAKLRVATGERRGNWASLWAALMGFGPQGF